VLIPFLIAFLYGQGPFSLAPYAGRDIAKMKPEDVWPLLEWACKSSQKVDLPLLLGADHIEVRDWNGDGKLFLVSFHPALVITTLNSRDWSSVYVCDASGKLLGAGSFSAGRGFVNAAALDEPGVGKVLRLRFNAPFGPNALPSDRLLDVGLDGDRPVCLGVSFQDGSLGRPSLRFTSFPDGSLDWTRNCDPIPSIKDVLRSGSAVQQLEAMAWLASPHPLPKASIDPGSGHEPVKASVEFAELQSDPEVDQELDALALSPVRAVSLAARNSKWWLHRGAPPISSGAPPRDLLTDFRVNSTNRGHGNPLDPLDQPVKVGDDVGIEFTLRKADGELIATNQTPMGRVYILPAGVGYEVAGFDRALIGMRCGDVRHVSIPYRLAYDRLVLPELPAYSDLDLTVKLIEILGPPNRWVIYRDLVPGAGRAIRRGMVVTVRFTARDIDGHPLSGPSGSRLASFTVGDSSGWSYETQGMHVGGKRIVRVSWPPSPNFDPIGRKTAFATVEVVGVRGK
jgi:hypothetical protein